jgi:hypothetical protein
MYHIPCREEKQRGKSIVAARQHLLRYVHQRYYTFFCAVCHTSVKLCQMKIHFFSRNSVNIMPTGTNLIQSYYSAYFSYFLGASDFSPKILLTNSFQLLYVEEAWLTNRMHVATLTYML